MTTSVSGALRVKPVVLFRCTGNSARSQMAEALLRKYADDLFGVYSAGTEARGIHPLTTRVMAEAGIDISGQCSKPLRQYLGTLPVRVAITVCAREANGCPVTSPGALSCLDWPFEDPSACEGTEEERLARFRAVRDEIERRVKAWLEEVAQSSS